MSAFEIIRESISKGGCISFARFMELALYHPEFGYYEHCRIGRGGDFFTSVSTGGMFGELLATQFLEWSHEPVEAPEKWVLLEAGAHDGRLALDILWHLNRQNALGDKRLEYWILEPSPRRKALQQKTLAAFGGHIRWFDGWAGLPAEGVTGVIFSNELLDAFPVHRLGWDAQSLTWFEWGVGVEGNECRWMRCPHSENQSLDMVRNYTRVSGLIDGGASDEDVDHSLSALHLILPDGYILEVCPLAWQWWEIAAESLKLGYLMTFDYGFQVEDLISPLRTQGTLRAYRQHHISDDLLSCPGEQDLTASVNFSMLQTIAERAGLQLVQSATQNLFLSQIVSRMLKNSTGQAAWDEQRLRQFHTLSHPDHLGDALKLLLLTR